MSNSKASEEWAEELANHLGNGQGNAWIERSGVDIIRKIQQQARDEAIEEAAQCVESRGLYIPHDGDIGDSVREQTDLRVPPGYLVDAPEHLD